MITNAICSVCGQGYRTRFKCQTCKHACTPGPIKWERISAPNYYAWRACVGRRQADVARDSGGQWFAFCTNGVTVRRKVPGEPTYESFWSAKKRATAFLRGKSS